MLLSYVYMKDNEHQRYGKYYIESDSSIMFKKILDMVSYQPQVLLFNEAAQSTSSAISSMNISGLSGTRRVSPVLAWAGDSYITQTFNAR